MNNKMLSVLLGTALAVSPIYANAADHAHEHEPQEMAPHQDEQEKHDDHAGHDDVDSHEEEEAVHIKDSAAELSGMTIETVSSRDIERSIPVNGRIALNKNRTSDLRARYGGAIEKMHVNIGDLVTKDQSLVTVVSNTSLTTYELHAPMSGTILDRYVNDGDVITDNVLLQISDMSSLWAQFHVFPSDLSKVNKGQEIVVRHPSFDREIRTTVEMIYPVIDPITQTALVIAKIDNQDHSWNPGMSADAKIIVRKHTAPLTVKQQALQVFEGRQVVFVKDADKYTPVPVEIGDNSNGLTEILSGLEEGQQYVSKGSFTVKSDLLKSTATHAH